MFSDTYEDSSGTAYRDQSEPGLVLLRRTDRPSEVIDIEEERHLLFHRA